jgi:hypothetical protein
LPEDSQANPGVYGFELALWLSQELARRGVVTSYPLGEDWGWLIEQNDGVHETVIGCASTAEAGEGYLNRAIRWRIFVRAAGIRSLFQRRAAQINTSAIEAVIESVLRDAGISFTR